MKNFLLLTVSDSRAIDKVPRAGDGTGRQPVSVYYPLREPAFRLLSLLTALYPGRIVLTGEREINRHTFLHHFREQGCRVVADVPSAFSALLPEGVKSVPFDAFPFQEKSPHPLLFWLHCEGEVPDAVWRKTLSLSADLAAACIGIGGGGERGTGRFTPEKALFFSPVFKRKAVCAIDLFPTIAVFAGVSPPASDGVDLSWRDADDELVCFEELWQYGLLSVVQGEQTLTCRIGKRAFPYWLARMIWSIESLKQGSRRFPTLWDCRPVIETASQRSLTPLEHAALAPGKKHGGKEGRRRLMGLLEAHLATYSGGYDDKLVMQRLQDLGYL